MSKAYVEIPGKVWLFVMVGVCLGWFSPNPALTSASLLILPILIFPLWLKGAPPVLSFLLFFQWLEATLKIFNANIAGIPVQGYVAMGSEESQIILYIREIEKAIWLSLGALASLAIGMQLGMAGIGKSHEKKIFLEKPTFFSVRKLFTFYIGAFIVSAPLTYLAWRFTQLTQILLALANVKWVLLFLLAFSVFQKRKEHHYLIFAILLEISTGFLGYFAQFRGVFYLLTVAFLTLHFRLRMRAVVMSLVIFMFAIFLGSAWSIVKKDYRKFLDEAAESKTSIPLETKIEKMSSAVLSLNRQKLRKGLSDLTERIAYVDFFAQVVQMVPRTIPHEQGELWKRALIHIVTPRLLFPDKPSLAPDSDITRKYTGIMVAGGELGGGTSIGIGYFAENYIDFGMIGMMFPIFLIGFIQGLAYRYFILKSGPRVFGYALASATLLFSGVSIATSSAKILAGIVLNFAVLALFGKLFGRIFLKQVTIPTPIAHTAT